MLRKFVFRSSLLTSRNEYKMDAQDLDGPDAHEFQHDREWSHRPSYHHNQDPTHQFQVNVEPFGKIL